MQKADFQTYLSSLFSFVSERTPSLSPQISNLRPVSSISLSNCCKRLPNPEISMNLRQLSQQVRKIQFFYILSSDICVKKSMFGNGNTQSCSCPCQAYVRVGSGQSLIRFGLLLMFIFENLTAFYPTTTYSNSLISSPLLLINSFIILPAFVPIMIL